MGNERLQETLKTSPKCDLCRLSTGFPRQNQRDYFTGERYLEAQLVTAFPHSGGCWPDKPMSTAPDLEDLYKVGGFEEERGGR
jgi:hypothetical protein